MNTQPNPFTKVETVAIIKALAKQAGVSVSFNGATENVEVAPGNYVGSVAVKVAYELTKGADYDTSPTVSLLSKNVVSRAMVLMGAQRENFLIALRNAATEALIEKKKVGDKVVAEDARMAEQLDSLTKEVLAKLPKANRSGPTTLKAQVARLDTLIHIQESESGSSAA